MSSAAIPKASFDWLPLALVPLLALLALPLIGSPSTWLTLIFGLMDVLNFGHGVFIALGAFVATSVMTGMADWSTADSVGRNLMAVFIAMVAAMLAVARAIVEPRELLLIDEPSKGLAPSIINNLIDAFRQLKAQSTTILLVEQNFQMAKALGDRVAVMDNGRVVHAGSMAELAEDEALQQRLLGLSLGAHQ